MAQIRFDEMEGAIIKINKQQIEAMAERICQDVAAVGENDKYRVEEVWKALSACLTKLEGTWWRL